MTQGGGSQCGNEAARWACARTRVEPGTSDSGYEVRTMTRGEVGFALELAAKEGWNPGLSDAGCFCEADPGGFFVGVLRGEPIGCISAVRYGDHFGFIGLYIVVPEQRRRGYGIALWRHALRYLEGRNIGLDGVVEQQPNYRKAGFHFAHRNVRYRGAAEPRGQDQPEIIPATDVPFAQLAAYDRTAFPAERERFLRCWLQMPGSKSVAWRDRELRGYGVIRPCREGFKIGPLLADTTAIAEALFASLCSHAPQASTVYLDIPATNPNAVALAERHHMSVVFETARMYTEAAPALAIERLYGITTFELG
jgi:ribosomal protein S18 acetylase RimI-like enzyme